MPFYDYECEACQNKVVDVFQSIKDRPLTTCEVCGESTLKRIIYPVMGFVDNVTTIGQYAERNTKKLGKDSLQEKEAIEKEKRKKCLGKLFGES